MDVVAALEAGGRGRQRGEHKGRHRYERSVVFVLQIGLSSGSSNEHYPGGGRCPVIVWTRSTLAVLEKSLRFSTINDWGTRGRVSLSWIMDPVEIEVRW